MPEFKNVMEVFTLLKKSNCKKCNKPTCLAFAAAVFQGRALLSECPEISPEALKKYGANKNTFEPKIEQDYIDTLEQFKKQIQAIDLASKAEKLGGNYSKNRLTFKMLGKDFSISDEGNIYTDIHVNPWVTVSAYTYIINGEGIPLTGNWVSFRELKTAHGWTNFFDHQCVKKLKKIADSYPHFFEDIIRLFNGRQVENHYQSDISLIIHPLPKVPVLICYNTPEDGLDSDLNLFFDSTADKNLPVEHIYRITAGITTMFEKIAINHA
jgi:hypothetical protein